MSPRAPLLRFPTPEQPSAPLDTSYICVVDEEGNVFSATPSDGAYGGTVAPGVGLAISSRGCQSWTDPGPHASALAPGKRPRLTPNPALAILDGGTRFVPFGTPGGDVQTQAMSQCLMNLVVHGMSAQEAVTAPRYASYSFPSSFEPHAYFPGLLKLESALGGDVGDDLARRGHGIEWWPDHVWLAGSGLHDRRRPGAGNTGRRCRPPPHGLRHRRVTAARAECPALACTGLGPADGSWRRACARSVPGAQ